MNDLSLYEQSPPHERKFPVKFHEITADTIPLHWHEYTELFFCNRAEADVYCSGTLYHPTEGELIIAHSNELHQMNGSLGSYCLRVHPDFFSDVEFDHIYFQVHIPADPFIKACFETIRQELEERKNGFDMAVKATTYQLFCHLLREYTATTLSPHELLLRQNRNHTISQVLDYICRHSKEKISTAALAERFHFNESYFCKIFKSRTGFSVTEYLNRYRAEQAIPLLTETALSITEIAETVGFDDPNYFTRTFKKHFGVPPMQYKKERR